MNGYDLNKEFRALARSYPQQAGDHVEQKLLAEFRRQHKRRTWLPAVAAAAVVSVIIGSTIWEMRVKHTAAPVRISEKSADAPTAMVPAIENPLAKSDSRVAAVMRPVVRHKPRTQNVESLDDNLDGFISLPSAIGGVPLGGPYIARVQMRAAQLSFAGLPVIASDPQQAVNADVFVESDGMIRAIRFR